MFNPSLPKAIAVRASIFCYKPDKILPDCNSLFLTLAQRLLPRT
jgi:hypothetical protein